LKVALLVPSAKPAAVSDTKPLLISAMLYDMVRFLKKG
jgi:hypothetical protein